MDSKAIITAPEPAVTIVTMPSATRATTDAALLASWVAGLPSPHTRRNFQATGDSFLSLLSAAGCDLRSAAVEDVRTALEAMTANRSKGTGRQYVLRVKSLLSYAHRLGYTAFNAGVVLKVKSGPRGAQLAKRILSEVDTALLLRAATKLRDRLMLDVLYGGGLRVSELVGLNWDDVIPVTGGRVQLSILGKGDTVRQVLLPPKVGRRLIAARGNAQDGDPVFLSRFGKRLSTRAVHALLKRRARDAGVTNKVSPHWLRHAHGSHALDRGATLAEVQATLGHANISTTSGYLHARPDSASGLQLDEGIFGDDDLL